MTVRLSVRTLQTVFFLIVCVWFILMLKNVSDLPTIGEETGKGFLQNNNNRDSNNDSKNGDRHYSVGRQPQDKKETLESIYGIENRIRNKYNTNNNNNMMMMMSTTEAKKKQLQKFNPTSDKSFQLGGNIAGGTSNFIIGNNNATESSLATNTNSSVNDISNSNSNINGNKKFFLERDYYDDNDDFISVRKRRRRPGVRRGQKRNRNHHHGTIKSSRLDGDDDDDDVYPSSPRLREKPSLLLPTPIIVMGFPKAGTSSIFAFFQRQGLLSQHWYCCGEQTNPKKGGPTLMADCLLDNLKRNKSTDILNGCGRFDVYSEINGPRRVKNHPRLREKKGYLLDDGTVDFDGPGKRIFFPQHFRIQELHESYPNATWILNWRDFDAWIESVVKWGTNDRLHDQFMNEYFMQGAIPILPKSNNITATKEIMKKIYDDHHQLVRDFVQRHPSHALVEVNITNDNASVVLAEAFGLDPNAWKNINKNKRSFISSLRATREKMYSGFDFIGSSFWWILLLVAMWYFIWTLGLEWT